MKTVDARQLACPEPVLLTAQALRESYEVLVIVDNEEARDNISRLAESEHCDLRVQKKKGDTYLTLRKTASSSAGKTAAETGVVVLVASEHLGRGESGQLGSLLMQSFLHTLGGLLLKPETIIFINTGVKLVTDGSPVLAELQALQEDGIELLACGTCLNFFHLVDNVKVGQVSNMYTIADTMLRAGKVLSL